MRKCPCINEIFRYAQDDRSSKNVTLQFSCLPFRAVCILHLSGVGLRVIVYRGLFPLAASWLTAMDQVKT